MGTARGKTSDKSTPGSFAPGRHDEPDAGLADLADLAGERHEYRPYEPSSWAARPVHDVMTEMGPDLAAHVRGLRAGGQTPPAGYDDHTWGSELSKLERAFDLMTTLKDEPFLASDARTTFDAGMDVLRRHGVDGRLAVHLAGTITPALRKHSNLIADLRRTPSPFGDVLAGGAEWEVEVRECAEAFEAARVNFVNGISTPDRDRRTQQAAEWLADNYLSLWV